jgi:hypothetical protein
MDRLTEDAYHLISAGERDPKNLYANLQRLYPGMFDDEIQDAIDHARALYESQVS